MLGVHVDDLHVPDPWDNVEPQLQLDVRDRRGRLLGVGAVETFQVVKVFVAGVACKTASRRMKRRLPSRTVSPLSQPVEIRCRIAPAVVWSSSAV